MTEAPPPPELHPAFETLPFADWQRKYGPKDANEPPPAPASLLAPTTFVFRDPRTIPPRRWLHGRHYVRSFVSATVAPAGLGKTSLSFVDCISMATGRALLGEPDPKKLRVWAWNGEDPQDEIERRASAIMLRYGLDANAINDRFCLDSGRAVPITIGTKHKDSIAVAEPVVAELIRVIRDRKIDVMVVDPFVSCHGVPENDNGAIDRITKQWARIADETSCSIDLVHHVRKPSSGSSDFTVDDARGASALIGAVRSARVLNVMSKDDAEKAGISPEDRRSYFRVDNGKANMQPPVDKAVWRKIVGVPLDNGTIDDPGDWVGVVTPWDMPTAFEGLSTTDLRKVQDRIAEGEWRESSQAQNWAGKAVAAALRLDIDEKGDRARIKTMLKTWIKNDALKSVVRLDDTRHERNFVEVGAWAT